MAQTVPKQAGSVSSVKQPVDTTVATGIQTHKTS